MTTYFWGGYYLIRPTHIKGWSQNPGIVYSASNCINESLLETWAYSWTTNNDATIDHVKQVYGIDTETINLIREWVDEATADQRIGWFNVFNQPEAAKEYQQKFFAHLADTKIVGIYFTESDTEAILRVLKPPGHYIGSSGLCKNLMKKIAERQSPAETVAGFDIVGIEQSGDFHSFYCNVAPEAFTERFTVEINQYGLFDDTNEWPLILDVVNEPENGFEPVPWFICKTKVVKL